MNQQVTFEDFRGYYLNTPNMEDDETDEYQNLITNMAGKISENLRRMDKLELPWDEKTAHWVIPGPFTKRRCFYFDLHTGESIFAQSDDILTEEEIYQYWHL
eukprot:5676166-Pyramimonas_sp.AAC.1